MSGILESGWNLLKTPLSCSFSHIKGGKSIHRVAASAEIESKVNRNHTKGLNKAEAPVGGLSPVDPENTQREK